MPRRKRKSSGSSFHESFSDMALLMLATFIFLMVTILLSSRASQQYEVPRLKEELASMQQQLDQAKKDRGRALEELGTLAYMNVDSQMEKILASAGLANGKGRKDFEVFVKGLQAMPGNSLHIIVDATGSMHGITTFLIPVLRVIIVRSGKHLDAITWFSDERARTYKGSMGEVLDKLMHGAPFLGDNETIGDAFKHAADNAPKPGAYLLIGDEPSDDRIYYNQIPSPVFTLPMGRKYSELLWEYQKLSDKTGGKMLTLTFK